LKGAAGRIQAPVDPRAESPTPRRRGAPVVERVRAEALAQLAAGGYAALSLPAVAAAAGVHKTSVYRRWPTKLELVRDALSQGMGHDTSAPDTGSLRGDIRALARAALGFVESPLGRGVLRTLIAEGGDPELRGLAQGILAAQAGAAPAAVFGRAVARGEWAPTADQAVFLRALAGALLHRVLLEQEAVTDADLDALLALLLDGARPR